MKKIKFPYKVYKGGLYPIINILMKGPEGLLETEAYVDTGASVSIFLTTIASDLGIDYTKGKLIYTMVGDGGFIPVLVSWNFEHMVKLKTKIEVNRINQENNYPQIYIISPMEV